MSFAFRGHPTPGLPDGKPVFVRRDEVKEASPSMRVTGVDVYVALKHGVRRLNALFARPWDAVFHRVYPCGRKGTGMSYGR